MAPRRGARAERRRGAARDDQRERAAQPDARDPGGRLTAPRRRPCPGCAEGAGLPPEIGPDTLSRVRDHPMTARPNLSRTHALRRAARGLAAVVLLAAGCSRPDDLQDVALRLGPADFGLPAPAVRSPVLQIGDEARPVVERAETITVLEKSNVPVRDGVAEVTVDLPPSASRFDDDSFVLSTS